MKHILIVCLCLSTPAFAEDFASRVAEAKRASSTAQGRKYDHALGPAIGAAIRACVPPGSTSDANFGDFVLVGYVARSGAISSVEVMPKTEVSVCFGAQFEQARLPPPPAYGDSPQGFPIVVEMSIRP